MTRITAETVQQQAYKTNGPHSIYGELWGSFSASFLPHFSSIHSSHVACGVFRKLSCLVSAMGLPVVVVEVTSVIGNNGISAVVVVYQ